jgi:hypothetical protein
MNTVFVLWLLLTGSPNVGELNGVYMTIPGCYAQVASWNQVFDMGKQMGSYDTHDQAVCVDMPVKSLGGKDNYAGEVYVLVVMPHGPPNLRSPQAGILTGVYRAGSDCYADAATKVANGQTFFCGLMEPKP